MLSVNDLLREGLEAFGAPESDDFAGELAGKLRRQLLRVYRVRLAQFIDGWLREGEVTFQLADGTETYAWPESLSAPMRPLVLVDAAGETTEPSWYTTEATFWTDYQRGDVSRGLPSGVLVRGMSFRFRQIPNGVYTARCAGLLYPAAPVDDDTPTFPIGLEDALSSGMIFFTANQAGHDEIAARYRPIFEASTKQLQSVGSAKAKDVYHGSDF